MKFTIKCCVCGKEFETTNEQNRPWCSVGCQYENSPFSNWYEDWEAIKPNEKLEKALTEMREYQEQAETAYENDADKFWNSLSKEDQLKCFYSVCKRIHEGDIAKRGTYRYVLYDVFGFGPEAYMVGMNCGYMAIHNGLFPDEESNA